MMFVRLAVLNLTRNLRRTLLSLGAVVVGVWVLIIGHGFVSGIEENIVRTEIDTVSAHVQVRPIGYPTEGLQHPVDPLLTVDEAAKKALDAEGGAWTTRLLFTPRLVHGPEAIRVRAIGFDPARDGSVFPRDGWEVQGAVPASAADGVLVGEGLARLMKVSQGDRVVLEVRTTSGALNALDEPVSGIVRVNNPMIDRIGVLVPMDLAQDLVQADGKVSHLLLRLPSRERTQAAAAHLAAAFQGVAEVHPWRDDIADMLRVQDIRREALEILVLALLAMSAAGITNTVLMAAYERIREIGTLRAMGMTEADVMRLFLLEGAMLGTAGALVGGALGAAMTFYWSTTGIELSGAEKIGTNIPFSTTLYSSFEEGIVVLAMVFGVAVAVGASVFPARVASRMAPAEAVKA